MESTVKLGDGTFRRIDIKKIQKNIVHEPNALHFLPTDDDDDDGFALRKTLRTLPN